MISLLAAAGPFIGSHGFKGIRVSTRPDAIDDEILTILKKYGVTSIELGAQTTSDRILEMNTRGHTKQDIVNASNLIKSYGIELGLQMMTGLYGSNDEDSIQTAKDLISLNPKTVRIYPTVLLKDTPLADLYYEGKYIPQTVEDAADLCAKLLLMFEDAGITVIRLGLHSGGGVEEGYIAGAYHPAFREIVESKIYLNLFLDKLKDKGKYTIFVSPRDISKALGQKRINIEKLNALGFDCIIKADESLVSRQIRIEERS